MTVKPTTTPFPAISTNSATSLHVEFEDLSKLDKTATPEFLLTLKPQWVEAVGADFGSLSHAHQKPPARANSGDDWLT